MRGRPGSSRSYGRGPIPLWLQALLDGYLRYLNRRGRRANTLKAYRYEIQDFAEYLNLAGVGSLLELQRSHVEEWQDDVAGRKALKTRQVASTAVRGLLKWCADQDRQMSNPMLYLRLESPRVPAPEPRPIPRADLEVLQEALREPDFANIIQLRTRALFWILYSSGSRIGAVLSMNRDSIRDHSAHVIQKGGRPHVLLFSELAVSSVNDYLAARLDDNPALFLGHGGWRTDAPNPGHGTRLTASRVDSRWVVLSKELGIEQFSSHRIRHSCATTMLRNGVDSLVAAKHLGHRDLQTIQNYAEIALEQRREAVIALSA